MPKFEFKPITRPMDLADYAPEYTGAVIHVWVNMPRVLLSQLFDLQREAADLVAEAKREPRQEADGVAQRAARWADIDARLNAWYAQAWSQHADAATHWTAADVKDLSDHLVNTDPQAWYWLSRRCQDLLREYRTAERKN